MDANGYVNYYYKTAKEVLATYVHRVQEITTIKQYKELMYETMKNSFLSGMY